MNYQILWIKDRQKQQVQGYDESENEDAVEREKVLCSCASCSGQSQSIRTLILFR